MERLADIIKRKTILPNTSEASTDTWSNAEHKREGSTESVCPLCKGFGLVYPISPSGSTDFSRVIPCRCRQKELRRERLIQLQHKSNLGALSRLTFQNLTTTGRKDDPVSQELFKRTFEAAKAFAESPVGWFILIGPNGSGKTHLACAIANYCLDRGDLIFYVSTADLLDHLRATFSPNSEVSHDELFEHIKNISLLILDDLTTTHTSPWAKGKLVQLLDHRFNLNLPTVITSREQIEAFDQELKGHLSDFEYCRVYHTGVSPSLIGLDNMELTLLRKMTFKSFDYKRLNLDPEERQNLEQAYKLAMDFSQSPQGWLVLQGVNGCGKTHLAAAIANILKQSGRKVLFIVVPDLLDYLRSTYNPESKFSYDDVFEQIKKAEILILDDFGEQATTNWAQEKLYQLINHRYNAALATVITTCLSLDEIENRISSRLVDPSISLVFNIIAPDYRGDRRANRTSKSKNRTLK